ncbi:NAD(P)H-binding protein [Nocardia sp. NPDC058176]|uniref:NAD(P)H-binding protein n=1 Tax=Nocardia sp. NPDC058176 TaxID=3346368 RepID=UPI0036DD6FCD
MIVVTGATGNIGRTLVQVLVDAGEQVTAISRGITESDVPAGVRPVRVDLLDLESLGPALAGADALFLLITGDWLTASGDLSGILDAARAGGIRRIVFLSSQGVSTGRHPSDLEEVIEQSGLEWTILRPGGFASNAFQWIESVRAERTIAAPFGDVALPVIDPVDIAEVAAAVLREPGHGGHIYDLTGPAAISPREQAEAIADALAEPVRFVELTREQARTQMLGFMPEPVVESTLAILGEPSGEQEVSPDVEKILGRAPGTFAQWVARNVAAFR